MCLRLNLEKHLIMNNHIHISVVLDAYIRSLCTNNKHSQL